jgi:hypothetical protein
LMVKTQLWQELDGQKWTFSVFEWSWSNLQDSNIGIGFVGTGFIKHFKYTAKGIVWRTPVPENK